MKTIKGLSEILGADASLGRFGQARTLRRAADYIERGHTEREGRKLPPADTALGFLKRGAYLTIETFIEDRAIRTIEGIAKQTGRITTSTPAISENPFHWGLLAMFDANVITKEQRRLFASQLLYAHRHQVPECYLIGFIYQLGETSGIYEKVRTNRRETWFDPASARTTRM